VLICTSLVLMFIDAGTPIALIAPLLFFNGIGMGLWNTPNTSATLGAVPRSQYGSVSAFVNLTRNVGNVTGQAIVATIVTAVMIARGFDIQLNEIATTPGAPSAFLAGWRAAYIAVVAFAGIALVSAVLTRPPREAPAQAGGAGAPAPAKSSGSSLR
jgi:sugar phosphate permease